MKLDFLKLNKIYPDFRYLFALCRNNIHKPKLDFLVETLNCLTAMKNNCYTPMSLQTKMEIQKHLYQSVLKEKESLEVYLEIVGEDDVLSNSIRN